MWDLRAQYCEPSLLTPKEQVEALPKFPLWDVTIGETSAPGPFKYSQKIPSSPASARTGADLFVRCSPWTPSAVPAHVNVQLLTARRACDHHADILWVSVWAYAAGFLPVGLKVRIKNLLQNFRMIKFCFAEASQRSSTAHSSLPGSSQAPVLRGFWIEILMEKSGQ